MRCRIWLALPCLWWLAACHSQGKLEPDVVQIPHAWVGFTSRQELSFKLDGKPVENPKLQITVPGKPPAITCSVTPEGPLGVPPTVECRPERAGDFQAVLTVTVNSDDYTVPVLVHAESPPTCMLPTDCQTSSFDPVKGQCVLTPRDDGALCGTQHCGASTSTCAAGMCVETPDPDPFPACPIAPSHPTMLQPAWSKAFGPHFVDPNVSGVADEAGNVYFLLDAMDGPPFGIVSLDPQGQQRWLQQVILASSSTNCVLGAAKLRVVGDRLVVFDPCLSPGLQSLQRSDGTPVWGVTDALQDVVDAGNGQLLALQGMPDGSVIGILPLDAATGARGMPVALAVHESSALVSDGQGTVFSDTILNPAPMQSTMEQLVAVQATGLLWTQQRQSDMSRTPVATDGQRLFMAIGDVLDNKTGKTLLMLPEVSQLQAVASAGDPTFVLTLIPRDNCSESTVLQRVDPGSGQPLWRCALGAPSVPPPQLLLTEAGGVALFDTTQATPVVTILDGNGQLVTQAVASDTRPITSAIAEGRLWAVSNDLTAIVAFDLPALKLAAHGWVSSDGGNPGHSGAPR